MLVNTIEEIKTILPVGAGNDFNRLRPHLLNAEKTYIIPLTGQSFYDELEEFYSANIDGIPDNPTDTDLAMQEVLRKIRHSIVNLAYYVGFEFLNVSISDMGFSRIESQTTKSLFKYQEDNLRSYFLQSGLNSLDETLLYLEENIAFFDTFKASANYTVFKQMFVPTASAYNDIYFINNSRLTFLRLKAHMALIENTVVKPVFGTTLFNFIKTEMAAEEPDDKVTAVLPYIRNIVVWLSSALLMEETGADLAERGLYFSAIETNNADSRHIGPTPDSRVAILVARNRSYGNSFVEELKTHLSDNATDWPILTVTSGTLLTRDNTDKKTFWA